MVLGAYFPEGSGISFQCRELVLELKNRVRFTILVTSASRKLPPRERVEGVPVYRIFFRPGQVISQLTAACRMAFRFFRLRRDFEIVHLHSVTYKNLLITCLAKLFRKKLLLHLATGGTDEPSSVRAKGILDFWCYRHADLYSIVNPQIHERCRAVGFPKEKCRSIPDGVNTHRFRPADPREKRQLRRELGLPEDGKLILFVGFFSREKGPDLLFRAWSRIQGRPGVPSTDLVFIGATRSPYHEVDPALADTLRAEASRAGIGRRLFFVELTLEIEKYVRACDLFVLPSVREGMPNALLEAMSCGLSCIATRLPGITDTLIQDRRTGMLFPARDEAALAEQMEWALLHPEEAEPMGRRAREAITRAYSIEIRGRRVLEQYRALLGQPTQPVPVTHEEWLPSGMAG